MLPISNQRASAHLCGPQCPYKRERSLYAAFCEPKALRVGANVQLQIFENLSVVPTVLFINRQEVRWNT